MRIKRKPPTSPQYIQIRLKETDGGISNELTIRAEIKTNCIVVCYKITKIVGAFLIIFVSHRISIQAKGAPKYHFTCCFFGLSDQTHQSMFENWNAKYDNLI